MLFNAGTRNANNYKTKVPDKKKIKRIQISMLETEESESGQDFF